jgi:hypothetical protein
MEDHNMQVPKFSRAVQKLDTPGLPGWEHVRGEHIAELLVDGNTSHAKNRISFGADDANFHCARAASEV